MLQRKFAPHAGRAAATGRSARPAPAGLRPLGNEDVKKIRVILTKLPPLLSDLLTPLIGDQRAMKLVGAVNGNWKLLRLASKSKAHVVILPLSAFGEAAGICTHLLAEFPKLFILALPNAGGRGVV